MSIKSSSKSMNIINSNIINSANVDAFEQLVKPTSELVLRYKLSDYEDDSILNNAISKCYTQFEYNYLNGMSYNLIILVKTGDNKVFGVYIPRCGYSVSVNDKLKPYIFSLDEGVIIGNRPDSDGDGVGVDFDSFASGLTIYIDGYCWELFKGGWIRGTIETTVENLQNNNNIAYDIFGTYIMQEDDRVRFMINYQEIEVYQIIDDMDYIEPEIITDDNIDVFENLVLPIDRLKLIQTFKDNDYYLDNRVRIGQVPNVVIIVKSILNKTFGVYKKDGDAYFYSVDLNEKCPLTNAGILIDAKRVVVNSNEFYLSLELDVDKGTKSNIWFDGVGLFNEFEIDQLIGDITTDEHSFWLINDDSQPIREFKWLEVDVYQIKD